VWFLAGEKMVSLERIAHTAMFGSSTKYTKMQFCVRWWFMVPEPCPSAFTLFSQARHRRCFLPQDKIFSLCGMAERGKFLNKLEDGFPDPDYSKPVAEVYQEAAVWALTRQKYLEFLYLAVMSSSELSESSPTASHLPSWVPDFARLSAVKRHGVPLVPLHSLDRCHAFNAFPGANPAPDSVWHHSLPPPGHSSTTSHDFA
jgi:hypothetical protein